MSSLDYGVLIFKDGKPINKGDEYDTTDDFELLGLTFHRCWIIGSSTLNKEVDLGNLSILDEAYALTYLKRKVVHWNHSFEGTTVKMTTRCLGERVYATSFYWQGNHWHIIQGYDVAWDRFWNKGTFKRINKYLGRFTTYRVPEIYINTPFHLWQLYLNWRNF